MKQIIDKEIVENLNVGFNFSYLVCGFNVYKSLLSVDDLIEMYSFLKLYL